jgi:hypothetical protein
MTRHRLVLCLLCLASFASALMAADEILLRFPGTLKSISRKEILLDVDHEQELVFHRAKKVKFLDGGKESTEKAAPIGDHVVIEGRRALNGDLLAVNVLWNEKPETH